LFEVVDESFDEELEPVVDSGTGDFGAGSGLDFPAFCNGDAV